MILFYANENNNKARLQYSVKTLINRQQSIDVQSTGGSKTENMVYRLHQFSALCMTNNIVVILTEIQRTFYNKCMTQL